MSERRITRSIQLGPPLVGGGGGDTLTTPQLPPSSLFYVGLPDTQGGMCWLAGYESDPTRYYTPSYAMTFSTRQEADDAIERAKKTHPFKERTYRIMTVAEMETQNIR